MKVQGNFLRHTIDDIRLFCFHADSYIDRTSQNVFEFSKYVWQIHTNAYDIRMFARAPRALGKRLKELDKKWTKLAYIPYCTGSYDFHRIKNRLEYRSFVIVYSQTKRTFEKFSSCYFSYQIPWKLCDSLRWKREMRFFFIFISLNWLMSCKVQPN